MDRESPLLKDDSFSINLHYFLRLAICRTTSTIDSRHVKAKV